MDSEKLAPEILLPESRGPESFGKGSKDREKSLIKEDEKSVSKEEPKESEEHNPKPKEPDSDLIENDEVANLKSYSSLNDLQVRGNA